MKKETKDFIVFSLIQSIELISALTAITSAFFIASDFGLVSLHKQQHPAMIDSIFTFITSISCVVFCVLFSRNYDKKRYERED